jgi:hypothetical protein
MKFRPRRYQCPRCQWDFAFRKKRCCPGCGTLLLIASDVPTDAELTEIKNFWMWDPVKEILIAAKAGVLEAAMNYTSTSGLE